MHLLLTGASGFIGQHLLRRLVREGHAVSCLVRAAKAPLVRSLGGRALEADLLNPTTLPQVPDGVDAVIHLVGGGGVSTVGDAGLRELRRLNVDTVTNLLAALPSPPGKVVLFSSVSAQGVRGDDVVHEDTPCLPQSPHELAKRESEVVTESWCAQRAVPLAVLRPAQVYGPGDVRSEIPAMLRLLRMGMFPVFGPGDNVMVPMIHVEDVVEFALRALALQFQGIRYFTLTGRQFTVVETAEIFSRVVGRRDGSVHVPKRAAGWAASTVESLCRLTHRQPPLSRIRIHNMTVNRAYDNSKTVRELAFTPARGLEEGMRETYAWYLATGTRGLASGVADYYPLALAEGEGVGTAYEYLAKARILRPLLSGVQRMLIAGLPEKYGSSLDFIALARALGAELVIVDDRQQALDKAAQAMARAGLSDAATLHRTPLSQIGSLAPNPFDLALSCEVLQRLPAGERALFVAGMGRASRQFVTFAPNAGNSAHATRSHLGCLTMAEMTDIIARTGAKVQAAGFVDMPPFPPGLTLSGAKREQVQQAWWQRPALSTLGLFCRLEQILPVRAKRPFAHIVYAVAAGRPD